MENKKIGLIIIFNHKYENNIPFLKEIYRNRFKVIRFLMPFYEGNDPTVITVYESSYQFQGYVAQAYEKLVELNCDHYVFIADDLLLNPNIDENNILEMLNVHKDDAYIEKIAPLYKSTWIWNRFIDATNAFGNNGVNFHNEIYNNTFMRQVQKYYGNENLSISGCKKIMKNYIYTSKLTFNQKIDFMIKIYKHRKDINIEYPLVMGYSDFFIIPKSKLKDISHLFGIFAAMGLFVEIAIPTAMMLIMNPSNLKMIDRKIHKAAVAWAHEEVIREFEQLCKLDIKRINQFWPKDYLYMHPIKLSKWHNEY